MPRTSKQIIAYHEAGHALADFKFGFKIKSVTIVPKGGAAGLTSVKNTLRLSELEYSQPTGRQIGHYHNIIVSLIAGAEAQRRFRPRSVRKHHIASDYDGVADLLLRLHPEEKERYYALKYLHERARNLVSRPINWRGIEDLAKALLEHKTLSGEEVERVLVASFQAQMEEGGWKRGNMA